jgi:hypothetical protein
VSTVKKSTAMMFFACARTNSRHDGPLRVPAGPSCASRRIFTARPSTVPNVANVSDESREPDHGRRPLRRADSQLETLGSKQWVQSRWRKPSARGSLAIEHVMPRKWLSHWPLDGRDEAERDRMIHTLGNLTLLTKRLNSKQSNGPWRGEGGKREGLERHDVLFLNRELLKQAGDKWTDDAIALRTKELTEAIIRIWPVPPGYKSGFSPDRNPRLRKKVHLSDLINAGVLTPGMMLFPKRKKFSVASPRCCPMGKWRLMAWRMRARLTPRRRLPASERAAGGFS